MSLKTPDIVNGKCFAAKALVQSPPLIQNGKVVIQAHHIGWLICGVFTLIACVVSFWLVDKHLQWYTNKKEQRYIVRILFMVPIYAIVSFGSFLFWDHATAIIIIRDCYESTVLTSFFYLLLLYISPSPDEQRLIFKRKGLSKENDRINRRLGLKEQHWMFPLGAIKAKPKDGLYFLQMMKWGVLQYCVIRPATTIAAVILNYNGLYCDSSLSPGWGHVYIIVIVSVSVSIAMYCLIQLYVPVAAELAPHQPILKLLAIKAVVFLTFWQSTFLSVLALFKVVKDTQYMTADDINIGIGAIAECVEMSIFAFIHVKAFTYKVYVPETSPYSADVNEGRTARWPSLVHAFNFAETGRELKHSIIYLFDRMAGRHPRPDYNVRRLVVLDEVFPESKRFLRPSYADPPSYATEKPQDADDEHADRLPTLPSVNKSGYFSMFRGNHQTEQQLNDVSREYEERLMAAPADRYGQNIYTPLPESDLRELRRARKHRRSYTIDAPGHFEDPPPASALQAYRQSRHIPVPDDLAPPPPLLRLREASDAKPESKSLLRADSVLQRIFPDSQSRSDLTSDQSSQSHDHSTKAKHRSRSPMGEIVPQLRNAETPSPAQIDNARRSRSMKADVVHSPPPKTHTPDQHGYFSFSRPEPATLPPNRRASAPLSFIVNEPSAYSDSLTKPTYIYDTQDHTNPLRR